ncbi:DUF3524 domain-containing protein [Wenzhouxiangella sp. XN79A]|uniref:tRNA-queuosine alpha-mannosyltransferase domain-containing protein n=1 Tax=Wenzhouxiangella sp. XN79A TaxID=2724193 RepID=UPI00144A8F81|nr:DUF3524 domain-containing protein [Wenzhouxiangella sp. XN79A]NKI33930.1 DUF3524 domain-containing protein [Wenzhouxiangella sp. XN79A]
MSKPCIWLLSAYRSESHAHWADGLVRRHRDFDWRRFELPGRHFAWRIRGNPLSWLDDLPSRGSGETLPDAVLATSMVDLATIRGLHPRLAAVPTLLYFHENQFVYPKSDRQTTSVDAQMVQLYAALAADRVAFNSEYNRRTFLDGVDALMRRMPDFVPEGLVERIASNSGVLPVPVDAIAPAQQRDAGLIVWNHRWEYDKNPELFAEAVCRLAEAGIDFRLALLGPRGARPVRALERLRAALADRIVVDRAPDRAEYAAVLARAGIVVSTARHEFQGLAVLEAVGAGCRPVVPDALCYPEQFDPVFRYPADDLQGLFDRLCAALRGRLPAPPSVTRWTGPEPVRAWAELLHGLSGDGG